MFCDLYNIAFQKEEIEDESKHSNTPCTAKGLRKFFKWNQHLYESLLKMKTIEKKKKYIKR